MLRPYSIRDYNFITVKADDYNMRQVVVMRNCNVKQWCSNWEQFKIFVINYFVELTFAYVYISF